MTAADASALLERIRGERGYALSYHELLARSDPRLLSAYRDLYAEFTLNPRHLDARRREIVWTGLLTAIDEHVGSIHLERARTAGVTVEELRAAVRLAGAAAGWDAVAFATHHWPQFLDDAAAEDEYRILVDGARAPLDEVDTHLTLCLVAGARTREDQFLFHLRELYHLQVAETHIAETVSYLLLPTGANTLLWATDLWFDAVRDGIVEPGDILREVSFETRRR